MKCVTGVTYFNDDWDSEYNEPGPGGPGWEMPAIIGCILFGVLGIPFVATSELGSGLNIAGFVLLGLLAITIVLSVWCCCGCCCYCYCERASYNTKEAEYVEEAEEAEESDSDLEKQLKKTKLVIGAKS
jgi:hypothetical protein